MHPTTKHVQIRALHSKSCSNLTLYPRHHRSRHARSTATNRKRQRSACCPPRTQGGGGQQTLGPSRTRRILAPLPAPTRYARIARNLRTPWPLVHRAVTPLGARMKQNCYRIPCYSRFFCASSTLRSPPYQRRAHDATAMIHTRMEHAYTREAHNYTHTAMCVQR